MGSKFSNPSENEDLATPPSEPPRTVSWCHTPWYMGRWYDLWHYPDSWTFGKMCTEGETTDITIEYTPPSESADEKSIHVLSTQINCKLNTIVQIEGKLEPTHEPGKYRLHFPGRVSDHWIVGLTEDYEFCVVSDRERKFLAILGRTPFIGAEDSCRLGDYLRFTGFSRELCVKGKHTQFE